MAFTQGKTIAELMQTYRVKRTTVISNLQKFVQSGQQLPIDLLKEAAFVSEEMLGQVLYQFEQSGDGALTPVYDALNGQVPYEELRLIRLIYHLQNSPDFGGENQ